MADISKIKPLGSNTTYNIKDNSAIANITRSGTTFTATRRDGTTFTFNQQDNNTWNSLSTSQAGYVAKAPNDTNKFLRGDATWAKVTWDNIDGKPTNFSPSTHTHGNITSDGTLQENGITIGDGDKILITDNSNSQKIVKTSISFDGTTTIKALTQKGTWETFLPLSGGTITGNINVIGNAAFNNTTTIDDAIIDSLLVNGNSNFINNVNFIQIPTAPTATAGTSTTQIATTEFVTNAIAQGFVANDAMVFKGLIGSNQPITQLPTSGYNAGQTYRVANAGIFAGEYCEVGDLLIAINDGPASGSSVINTDWGKVEHNIDGAVFRGSGASNSSVGSSTQPVYVNGSGIITAITGAIANDTTGNAATATALSSSGTINQFWRGDNRWSDTLGFIKINNEIKIKGYGDNNNYWHTIKDLTTAPLTNDRWHYLPNLTGWIVTSPTNGTGNSTTPIYIDEGGITRAITGTISNNTTGNAATATTLATGRTLKVNLASTSASTAFNGAANITDIGVSGILPIAQGGTGATSASDARINLGLGSFATKSSLAWNEIDQSGANSLIEGTSDVTDNTEIFTSYASNNGFADSNATGKVYRRDAIKLYNYIKTKAAASGSGFNISGTATNATQLISNNRMDYGWNGINYFNILTSNQSAAKVNDTPFSSNVWTHILRFNRNDPNGYYTDLAIPFEQNSIYYKRIAAGSLQNSTTNGGWIKVLDQLNYTSYTVTKTGSGASGTWNINISGNAATATVASKLSNNSKIGDTNKPVYFKADGTPATINYTIDKSVPSNAVFTDRYVNSATFVDDSTNTAASPVKMTLTRAGSDTVTVTANIPKVSSSSAGVAPKGASVSSQSQSTKFLREDGTWAAPSYTVNTNTDTLVKQTAKSDNKNYKILFTTSDSPTSGNANEAAYDTGITINPSTHTLTAAKFIGSLQGNAATAIKATQDGNGNVITSTYLPLSGGTMTGNLQWNGLTALPSTTTTDYFLAIDTFANGGTTKYITKGDALKSLISSSSIGTSLRPVYWTGSSFSQVNWFPSYCTVNGDNKNNYNYHRIATLSIGGSTWTDRDAVLVIRSRYSTSNYGIVKISGRASNNQGLLDLSTYWFIRSGFEEDSILICRKRETTDTSLGDTQVDVYLKTPLAYPRIYVYMLVGPSHLNGFQLINSEEKKDSVLSYNTSDAENPNVIDINNSDLKGSYEVYIRDKDENGNLLNSFSGYNPNNSNSQTTPTAQSQVYTHIKTALDAGSVSRAKKSSLISTNQNAIAYYTDTTGTFGQKASANGALYATSVNGSLQWGTLPMAQGGTGATTAAGARTNLGLGTMATETANNYIAKSIGTAKGDIIYWSAANTPARLNIGSVGQVLKVSSNGIPVWSNESIIGVKGNAEDNYRTGNVNITPANILGSSSTAKFWRGDNTWSDTLGFIKINNEIKIKGYGDNNNYWHSIKDLATVPLTNDRWHYLPNTTGWIVTSPTNGTGNNTTPIYIGEDGITRAITGTISNNTTGNAATATTAGGITSTGTTAQFWRGDNTWSNILAQPAETTLGIDTSDLRIGQAIRTLHIATKENGAGAGITEGDAAGITFGFSNAAYNAAYAGIYYQSSANYGSRLYFATTSSFGNGAYARMMITHDGKVGIHTASPSTRLHVDGDVTITGLTASQAVATDANKKLISKDLTFSEPTTSGTVTDSDITYIARISQDAVGKISATKRTMRSASTSQTGVLQFTTANTNAQLNTLTTGASTPTDNDYYISQYANGGTTYTSYHRRPVSALWNYMSGKITNGIYWANVKTTSAATYKAQPEVASIKINGKTAAGDTDSTSAKNVQLIYDASLETLNFVFS